MCDTPPRARAAFPATGRCPKDGLRLFWVEKIHVKRSLKRGANGTWLVVGADDYHGVEGEDSHLACGECLAEFVLPESLDYDPDCQELLDPSS